MNCLINNNQLFFASAAMILSFICISSAIEQEINVLSHPHGHPMTIMEFDENENFDVKTLDFIKKFQHPEVRDRKIVAISIIGEFRVGKSFLLNYALRFMYAHYKSISFPDNPTNESNWIGDIHSPLVGFSWSAGSSRDTKGIVMWSDVFLHEELDITTNTTEKIAIILMDTQGLFHQKTSPTVNLRISALGTLLSSIQIINLRGELQKHHLEYFDMSTNYAKDLMNNNNGSGPLETRIFLMRDWESFEDFEYGFDGGKKYLDQLLNLELTSNVEIQDDSKSVLEQKLCYLLPHPGINAAKKKHYDGRFSELDEEFQEYLKDFLKSLLGAKNFKKKKILNMEVTGSQYLEYLQARFEAFQPNNFPPINSIYKYVIKKQYSILLSEALAEYSDSFESIEFKFNDEWKKIQILEQEINSIYQSGQQKVLGIFREKEKLDNAEDDAKLEDKLKLDMHETYEKWNSKLLKAYKEFKEVNDAIEICRNTSIVKYVRDEHDIDLNYTLLVKEIEIFELRSSQLTEETKTKLDDIKKMIAEQKEIITNQLEQRKQNIFNNTASIHQEQMTNIRKEIKQEVKVKQLIDKQLNERLDILRRETEINNSYQNHPKAKIFQSQFHKDEQIIRDELRKEEEDAYKQIQEQYKKANDECIQKTANNIDEAYEKYKQAVSEDYVKRKEILDKLNQAKANFEKKDNLQEILNIFYKDLHLK